MPMEVIGLPENGTQKIALLLVRGFESIPVKAVVLVSREPPVPGVLFWVENRIKTHPSASVYFKKL